MTLEEVKDSIDKIMQDYSFTKYNEVYIKTDIRLVSIKDVTVDKHCRPLIIPHT